MDRNRSSDIYENSEDKVSWECEYANWEKPRNARNINEQEPQHSGDDTARRRCSIWSTVCVALLCVLLLSGVIVLSVKLNNTTSERDQLQISFDNMTAERDQLLAEKDGFQMLNISILQCQQYFITTEKKSWRDARLYCSSRGADLVIINSREEQVFISKLFKGAEAWIGLTDTVEEGKWKWVSGTELATGFWWDGEPNDFNNEEDCAVTSSKFAKAEVMTWADYPCNLHALAICKMNAN
ncbi:C-type lectin domain family 4 member E [Ictalurus punctatus]|uniref:C-type lectin domain family 4 member E n=1 Tax=Ictalurus punctatus TaxID=7998 RepID=A0A2D0S377_ICTPU|nr:C-type lectin domain family 4 member E [Ictalurus punctatus]